MSVQSSDEYSMSSIDVCVRGGHTCSQHLTILLLIHLFLSYDALTLV